MIIKLENCPHCDGDAYFSNVPQCRDACTRQGRLSEIEMIRQWNTRAVTKREVKLISALKQYADKSLWTSSSEYNGNGWITAEETFKELGIKI